MTLALTGSSCRTYYSWFMMLVAIATDAHDAGAVWEGWAEPTAADASDVGLVWLLGQKPLQLMLMMLFPCGSWEVNHCS